MANNFSRFAPPTGRDEQGRCAGCGAPGAGADFDPESGLCPDCVALKPQTKCRSCGQTTPTAVLTACNGHCRQCHTDAGTVESDARKLVATALKEAAVSR